MIASASRFFRLTTPAVGILLFFCFLGQVNASPFKLGKVSKEDFIQGVYEKDPDASAVIFYDYGSTRIDFEAHSGSFYYLYRKEMRLQIIDERGFDWADFAISLYEGSSSRESMSRFSGYVHNLEGNKVKTTKVKSRHGMTENTSDTRKTIKFSFPEVKPGSIIEIGYTIKSKYIYSLPHWQFQYSVPVEHSEYELLVPEYFNYQHYMQGYEMPVIAENKASSTSFSLPRGNRASDGTQTIIASTSNYRWVMEDVPALRPEPFSNSISNYLSMIHFELSSETFPGQPAERYITNWSDVDKRLQESEYFGEFLSGSRLLRKEMEPVDQMKGDETEIINAAVNYIRETVKWNEYTGLYSSGSPSQVIRKGEGNVADVNLLLVAALRHLGFDANPVVSSTRSNGMVLPVFPTISRFNYVLAHVKLEDGTDLLLDATDEYCATGMLPVRALNGKGRVIGDNFGIWIDLLPKHPSLEQKKYAFSLDSNGLFSGSAEIINKDYAAYSMRRSLEREKDMDKYKEDFQADFPGMTISKMEIENKDKKDMPVINKMELSISDAVVNTGDMIFFKPLIFEGVEENPFGLEERRYPVDFTYPIKEEITMVYDIPEGFEIDFLPDPLSADFKSKIFFSFSSVVNDQNQIEVKADFEVLDHLFLPEDYNGLKEFFRKMVEKHNEQISLKIAS